jgi:hypothetical protein
LPLEWQEVWIDGIRRSVLECIVVLQKPSMKSILCACFVITVAYAVRAQFNFITNNGAITVTGYTGPGGVVVVPSTTNGWPVTSIGTNAFYNTDVAKVTIPNSVTNIGSFAFFGCGSLTNIILPTNIAAIQDFTFFSCSNLVTVTIPTSVTSIGVEPFYGCTGLTSIVIPTNVTSIGTYAFSGCTGLTNITIPSSITTLGYAALSSCSGLTNAVVLANLNTLSDYLFFDCYDLVSVTFPNSVTNIGQNAFGDCFSLRSIDLPPNLVYLGDFAFYYCSSLTSISVPDGVACINQGAFESCGNLTSVKLPKFLRDIEGSAFTQCYGLTSLAIPDTVTNIGQAAFMWCNNLAAFALPTNITSISQSELLGCTALTNLAIPAAVTNIGPDAFSGCDGFTSITVPSQVIGLGDYAFSDCRSLSSLYFLGNSPSADSLALMDDNNLTVYYMAGTSGWSNTFVGYPAVMLHAPVPDGSLQVTINPTEAVIAGAFWQVDQGIPQPSGATVLGLSVGCHSIRFGSVGHWTKPADQSVVVVAGQTTSTNATYVVNAELGAYANAVLSLQPVAYWQLNETNQVPGADVIGNLGSVGVFGTGFPFNGVGQGFPGIVSQSASFSNPSLDATYLGSYVAIPFESRLNPAGPFTVEFWTKPNQIAGDYFCPVSSIDASQNSGSSRCGWLFYEAPGSQWLFRVGNQNGYVAAIAGGTVQTNTWQHVAGVYDGANIILYVNGSPVAGPAPASGYSPNANGAAALCIGATSFGNRTFDGSVDEVVLYTNALTANTVAAHYSAAFTNNGGYDAQILASRPVGYWNLDEPAYIPPASGSLPLAFNLGRLSALAYGVFEAGSIPGSPGVPDIGFGVTNLACAFQADSFVDVPGSSLQFSGPITLIAWVKFPPAAGQIQSVASLGTNAYRLAVDASGYPHFSDGIQSFGDLVGTAQINDNHWHQLAGVYNGTNIENLYVDGQLVAQSTSATASPVPSGDDFWIGGSPDPATFQFFNGVIDEVAIFTNVLTSNQVCWLYSAAANVPLLSTLKYSPISNSVTFSWSTVPGLTYQILSSTNLSQPTWTILTTNLIGTNSCFTISLTTDLGRQHFYRVIVLP